MRVSISSEEEKVGIEFPSIVKNSDGTVVLAEKGDDNRFSGTVLVVGDSYYRIGEVENNWHTIAFTPFNSSITISNE